jgi:hypothetical protein
LTRTRIDVSGGGTSAQPAASTKSAKSGGSDSSQKIKLIAAIVVGVFAIAVIAYQVMPGLFGGGGPNAGGPTQDITEPVVPESTDLAPGTKEPPIQPKPRGSGKRPVGG